MQGGQLRHRIVIQSPVKGTNPFDTAATNWNTVGTFWARVSPVSAKDKITADTLGMQVSHTITMRWPGKSFTVSAGDQILYGGRVFNLLKGILNTDERNIQVVLMAFEVNPAEGGSHT